MTIKEKRKVLEQYCAGTNCSSCPVFRWEPVTNLSCHFTTGEDDPDHWDDALIEGAYDLVFNPTSTVNHPGHYNREGAMECIDEMVLIFGREAVKCFCLCNAWKYRYRAADKNGLEDLKKSDWYLAKYKELMGGDK